jgi:hypothetical protein
MTLRSMDDPGCHANGKRDCHPEQATAPAAERSAQSARNTRPSAAAADRPPMTIPRDDNVAGSSCLALIRTRAATTPAATVRP